MTKMFAFLSVFILSYVLIWLLIPILVIWAVLTESVQNVVVAIFISVALIGSVVVSRSVTNARIASAGVPRLPSGNRGEL